ncbi:hypothetical protein PHYSODRAFT_518814 [Phytophthora sojae]|uniref:Eukaryotic/viral aspartic protease n=1 Tax=Phytophthora sojae (strain P6497) TaxID=1094619 RepID=G5A2A8_PHYSP|nr:hypothetical protein PHYSODRAFT_518814 [Phytophthora sojae]EGZ11056.1 hypothetical protein PHYSODRAFT_518814 [Phytophthora sojae]|eukprot:XP_009533801.1 hypothetical protein PHYSODRAFT_518814 [Phytophthora sojae]
MTGSDATDEELDGEYDDYLEEKAPAPAVVTPETPEDAVISAGRSGGSRSLARSLASELEDDAPPVSRNLADELDDVDGPETAYDDMEEFEDRVDDSRSPVLATQVTEQTSGNRPPMNGDTPAANKYSLGRCFEAMRASEWGRLFEPRMIRQAVWADLSHELARLVNAVTVEQVAKDTVTFLKALGLRPTLAASPSTLESFLPAGAELWQWKKKLCTAFEMTPFSLELPKAARTNKGGADPARVPLIPTFSGARNRGENSMQWLRAFVYEMKGTHPPPNEWCMPFELRLRDGAVHWHRQLTKKPKRTWCGVGNIKFCVTLHSRSGITYQEPSTTGCRAQWARMR